MKNQPLKVLLELEADPAKLLLELCKKEGTEPVDVIHQALKLYVSEALTGGDQPRKTEMENIFDENWPEAPKEGSGLVVRLDAPRHGVGARVPAADGP